MPLLNVEIHRLEWFAIVAILALFPFGQIFGYAGLLLVALRKLRARYLESDPYSGRK